MIVDCKIASPTSNGYKCHTNNAINLSMVISIHKSQLKYFPDNEGMPAIVFWFGEETNEVWAFDTEKVRDKTYESLYVTRI